MLTTVLGLAIQSSYNSDSHKKTDFGWLCHIYAVIILYGLYLMVTAIDRCHRLYSLRSVLISIDDNDIGITWLT